MLHQHEKKLTALFVALLAVGLLAFSSPSRAQAFPSHPVNIVVPFPPGGVTDVITRSIAESMRGPLGQTVTVENKPGAASLIALNYVRTRPADGYTLVIMSPTITTLPSLNANAKYSIEKDFTPVAGVGRGTMVLIAHKDTGISSVAELVAKVKAEPGKLNWGLASNLGFDHLTGMRVFNVIGVKIDTVGYQGSAPLTTDLMAGRVQVAFGSPGGFKNILDQGTVKALAVTSAERWVDLPDVPTLAEVGVKGVVVEPWFAAFGPAGIPANAVNVLNREITAAIQTPDVKARLLRIGFLPMPLSPAQITELAVGDEKNWAELTRSMGIKPQ